MRVAIVDCETTGLDRYGDMTAGIPPCRVVELAYEIVDVSRDGIVTEAEGVYMFRANRLRDQFQPLAIKINGYDDSEGGPWASAPDADSDEAARQWRAFGDIVNGATLCAQNVPFDRSFIEAEMSRVACVVPKYARRFIDTQTIAALVSAHMGLDSFGLDEAYTAAGGKEMPPHRAVFDVARCRYLLELGWRAIGGWIG